MTRLLLSGAAIALLSACSGGTEIEPGEWEMTVAFTEVSMPDAPEGTPEMPLPPAQTQTVCVTPEQAADPDGGMFTPPGNDGCDYTTRTMSGGNMTIAATCSPPDMVAATITLEMDGTYDRTSFNTDLDMRMSGTPIGDVSMTGTMTGEHKSNEC